MRHLSKYRPRPLRSRTLRSDDLRSRRRGISMVLFVAVLPLVFFSCAMVIDMGMLYNKRAQAQRAADAAALAGAITMKVDRSNDNAVVAAAKQYAKVNGYDSADSKTTVNVSIGTTSFGATSVKAVVSHVEPVYFAPVFEALLKNIGQYDAAVQFSRNVGSSATAVKLGAPVPLKIPGIYGTADLNQTPANLALFGPNAWKYNGDPYSTLYNDDGTPNPDYTAKPTTFAIHVTPEYLNKSKQLYVELYDPDSYSPNGNSWDEYREPNSHIANPGTWETTTVYSIFKPGESSAAGNTPIQTVQYGGKSDPAAVAANEKWNGVTSGGFSNGIPLDVYGTGDYHIEIKTINGSSENGFNLRAGPMHDPAMTDAQWSQTYGNDVSITSDEHLQINFTGTGSTGFTLGYVGPEAAGQPITIRHFDTDVGTNNDSINYSTDAKGQSDWKPTGKVPQPSNGVWGEDTIVMPTNWPGGNINASYAAGSGDTSSWEMISPKPGDEQVRLVE